MIFLYAKIPDIALHMDYRTGFAGRPLSRQSSLWILIDETNAGYMHH
jgi:hypothetical protein